MSTEGTPATTQNAVSDSTVGVSLQAGSVLGDIHVHPRPAQRTTLPPLRQLPPAVPDPVWIDRAPELAELTELAQRQGPVVIVLVGPEDVGTSALATRLLDTLGSRFPDGQFYMDLGGHRAPMPAETVLSSWLPALGFDVPSTLPDRSAAWRSATADGAYAVLLDHVVDEDQVKPVLLSSRRSITVITSRFRLRGLAFRGASLLPVKPLTETDSAALLEKVAGPGTRPSLVTRCAGHPGRLIRLAAWFRLRDPDETPTPDSDHQEVPLDMFDMLYDVVSPSAQQLYRCIGDHVPNVDVQTAVVMIANDRETTQTLLDELVNAELLEKRPAPTEDLGHRYVMSPSVHQHAAARAAHDPADVRAAVRKRVTDTLLGRLVAADYLLSPKTRRYNPAYDLYTQRELIADLDARAALLWITVELPAVLACMRDAHHAGDTTTVCYLAESTWAGYLRARYPEFGEIHEFASSVAHQAHHPMESIMWARLSWWYRNQRQWQAALETAESAQQAAVKAKDRKAESTAIFARARVLAECRYYSEARELYDTSRIIAAEAGDDPGVTLRLRHIADCWASEKHYVVAREMYLQVLEAAETQQDPLNWARTAGKLASVLIALDQPRQAVEYLTRAEIPMAEPESTLYHAEIVDALAQAHEALGNAAEARQRYADAAGLYQEAGEIGKAEIMRTRMEGLTDEEPSLGCRDARVHIDSGHPDRRQRQVAVAAVIAKGQRHGWTADDTADAVLGFLHQADHDEPSDHQR